MIYKLILLCALAYSIIPTYIYKAGMFNIVKRLDKKKNDIALTFDDGPDANYTHRILDLLKENNVKATFFVVAKHAEKNPELINRMINEGHSLGLHSLEHKNILVRGYRYIKRDFSESIKIMEDHNWPIKYYRPPWGQVNLFSIYFIKKYGLKVIMWNVMVGDWSKHVKPDDITDMLNKRTCNGSIICLHDARGDEGAPERTIEGLKNALPKLKQIYNFVGIKDKDDFAMVG